MLHTFYTSHCKSKTLFCTRYLDHLDTTFSERWGLGKTSSILLLWSYFEGTLSSVVALVVIASFNDK